MSLSHGTYSCKSCDGDQSFLISTLVSFGRVRTTGFSNLAILIQLYSWIFSTFPVHFLMDSVRDLFSSERSGILASSPVDGNGWARRENIETISAVQTVWNFRADLAVRNQSFLPDSEFRKGIEHEGLFRTAKGCSNPNFPRNEGPEIQPQRFRYRPKSERESPPPLEKIL